MFMSTSEDLGHEIPDINSRHYARFAQDPRKSLVETVNGEARLYRLGQNQGQYEVQQKVPPLKFFLDTK